MIDVLQIVASIGGVGAVFGIVVFFLYRYDRRSSENKLREDRKFMEDRLTKLLEDDQQSREENTRVLSELRILIEHLNGKSK